MSAEEKTHQEQHQQTPRELEIALWRQWVSELPSIPPLIRAILDGKGTNEVETLLDEGLAIEDAATNASRGGRWEVTPLMCAALWGRDDLVALFLDRGAVIDRETVFLGARTALEYAVISGSEDTVHLLLERGASVNQLDGSSALQRASELGDIPLMRLLCAYGAEGSVVSPYDAVAKGQLDALILLLEWGASLEKAFQAAVEHGQAKILQYLSDKYLIDTRRAELAPVLDKALFDLAVNGYEEGVAILLAAGAKPDGYKDSNGETALVSLASNSYDFDQRLKRKQTENKSDEPYYAPLIRIAERLLAAGADPRAKRKNWGTVFDYVCQSGRSELIRPLVVCDFSLVMSDASCLPRAAVFDDVERVEILCEVGMDLEATDHNGRTALFFYWGEHAESTQVLLANGARWDVVTRDGESPLDEALTPDIYRGNARSHVFFLLLYNATINDSAVLQRFLEEPQEQESESEEQGSELEEQESEKLAQTKFCWGALYEAQGNLDSAKASYESALTEFPEVHYRLARIYEKEENFQQAEIHFAALAQESDACKTVYYRLAQAYEQEGNLARAKEFYLKTTENKDFPRLANLAFHRLWHIAKQQGDSASQNKYYAELIQRKDHTMLFHATATLKARCVESTQKASGEKGMAVALSQLNQTQVLYDFIKVGQSFDRVFSFEEWQFIALDAISNPCFDQNREDAYVLAFYAVGKARGRATTPAEEESIKETYEGIKSVLSKKIEWENPGVPVERIAEEIVELEATAQRLGKPVEATAAGVGDEKGEEPAYAEATARQFPAYAEAPAFVETSARARQDSARHTVSSSSAPAASASEVGGLDADLDLDDDREPTYQIRIDPVMEASVAASFVPAPVPVSASPALASVSAPGSGSAPVSVSVPAPALVPAQSAVAIPIPPNLPLDTPGINLFANPPNNQLPDETEEAEHVFVEKDEFVGQQFQPQAVPPPKKSRVIW